MYNEYNDRLNSVDKKDYKMIEKECEKKYIDYDAYDNYKYQYITCKGGGDVSNGNILKDILKK